MPLQGSLLQAMDPHNIYSIRFQRNPSEEVYQAVETALLSNPEIIINLQAGVSYNPNYQLKWEEISWEHLSEVQRLILGGFDLRHSLESLPKLRDLKLENCNFKDSLISTFLSKSTHIQGLSISSNRFVFGEEKVFFDSLKELNELKYLSIVGAQFKSLSFLETIPTVRHLNIEFCMIHSHLSSISKLSNLESLSIIKLNSLTNHDLKKIVSRLKKLSRILLAKNKNVDSYEAFIDSFCLETAILDSQFTLANKDFQMKLSHIPNLKLKPIDESTFLSFISLGKTEVHGSSAYFWHNTV